MKKLVLSQAEIDKLVFAGRRVAEPTVHGVGCNDVNFQTSIDGNQIWQYYLWKGMLERCNSDLWKSKNPAYQNATCCVEWFSFANFFEWLNKEVGYSGIPAGSQLDKDVLGRGSKAYSPENCSCIPTHINNIMTDRRKRLRSSPNGVYFRKESGMFEAKLSRNGRTKHLGVFDTPEEAFLAYKTAKEAQIKAVANQYKDVLKPAVYESLMNWEIEP